MAKTQEIFQRYNQDFVIEWMCGVRKRISRKVPWCFEKKLLNQIKYMVSPSLFQIRGALNAVKGLTPATSEEKPKAVVTHSSGNHGQALAYAAKLEGT